MTFDGRVVDLVDTAGLLVDELQLPSHAAVLSVTVAGRELGARGYALDERHALLIGRDLEGLGDDGDVVTFGLGEIRSAGRTTTASTALRGRLARLMELPERALLGWTDRDVRHALLFVLEATSHALRDKRLMALEAALGGRNTL